MVAYSVCFMMKPKIFLSRKLVNDPKKTMFVSAPIFTFISFTEFSAFFGHLKPLTIAGYRIFF